MCREVRKWLTQNVLVPVTQFLTEAREVCDEVRQWIEEQIQQPVDQWISQQEERCRELPWWNPARWFCEIVTIVVKVVVWVVVTVGKWVVTIVCQVVTIVIGIVVTLVLRVVNWLVSFVVCIFTDPIAALKSFGDLWTIVVDTVEDIFEFVDVLLADVIGILTDIENLIDSLASSLGWLGVILGIIKGIIQLVREWVSIIRDAVNAIKDIVAGILDLNLCKLLRGLTNVGTAIGRALLGTGFVVLLPVRVIGAIAGGIRDEVNQLQLEGVIRSRVSTAFGAGTPREKRALDAIGINSRPMGLPFNADARRLFFSSNSRSVDLKALHDAGVINLWALAGYVSDCGRVINQADAEVVYAGTDVKVLAADLEIFLAEGPGSVPEFHLFPISRKKFRDHLEAANRKAAALGVRLFFRTIGSIQGTSTQHLPLNASDENPPGDMVQQALFQAMGRTGVNDDLSLIPTISILYYVPRPSNGSEGFGLASWFRPSSNDVRISGVTYRNRTPDWVFRFVLAHEIGHYWGLDHLNRSRGDRSLDEIMYAPSTGTGLSASAVAEYLLLNGEPRFTLDDARKVWDWITTDGAASLLP